MMSRGSPLILSQSERYREVAYFDSIGQLWLVQQEWLGDGWSSGSTESRHHQEFILCPDQFKLLVSAVKEARYSDNGT